MNKEEEELWNLIESSEQPFTLTNTRIKDKLGLSEYKINKALKSLAKNGFITKATDKHFDNGRWFNKRIIFTIKPQIKNEHNKTNCDSHQ